MHDYHCIKDHFADTLTEAGFDVRLEESVLLTDGTRACRILVYPKNQEPVVVWGELTYEWTVENQAFWNEIDRQAAEGRNGAAREPANGGHFYFDAVFHLRLAELYVDPEEVRQAAERMREQAGAFFPGGSVVAEVSWALDGARVEELRFHGPGSQSILDETEWWESWGDVFQSTMEELLRLFGDLQQESTGR